MYSDPEIRVKIIEGE